MLRDRVRAVARKRQLGRATFSSSLSQRSEPATAPRLSERPALTRSTFERPKLSERVSSSTTRFQASGKQYKLVAIGTSTGGPVALQRIITALPADFPLPIVLIQHMPAAFTGAFAQRLNSLAKIEVCEAKDNDVLRPGVAYLAPGGKQMLIEGGERDARLRVKEDDSPRITFKPSVDITFATAAKVYADKVLAVVLTGMGADGREGARLLKQTGSRIWAQDEASCVVYGMPQAIAAAGLMDVEVALNDVASRLITEVANG